MSRITRPFFLAVLLLALAGCGGGLLPSPAPPPLLYRLSALRDFPPDLPKANVQLVIEEPFATSALDTDRITLSTTPTSIDYFANVEWADRVTVLVQSLLLNSLENSGRLAGVARDAVALQPDFIMQSELRHFEAVYADAGAPQVDAEMEIKLIRNSDRIVVAQRVFEAHAKASANTVPAAIDAYNQAAHTMLQQIVAWTVQSLATARR
jgi:cholesterol transport system auxiliary component